MYRGLGVCVFELRAGCDGHPYGNAQCNTHEHATDAYPHANGDGVTDGNTHPHTYAHNHTHRFPNANLYTNKHPVTDAHIHAGVLGKSHSGLGQGL